MTPGTALAIHFLAWSTTTDVSAEELLRAMKAAGLTGPAEVRRDFSLMLIASDREPLGEPEGGMAAALREARGVLK